MIEVVAFTGPLADTGEDRVAAEHLGDIVDQFLDQNRLADAGAAEQADLAALGVGAEQVDDLDAGRQDFRRRGLLVKGRGRTVDRGALGVHHVTGFVDGFAGDRHDAAERARTDRNRDRRTGVFHFSTALEAFGGVHGDRADGVLAEVLGNLEDERLAVIGGFKGVEDVRQTAFEFNVHNSARYLGNAAFKSAHSGSFLSPRGPRRRR